ncbi:MAG: tape measure protein [Thiolinea sp.]
MANMRASIELVAKKKGFLAFDELKGGLTKVSAESARTRKELQQLNQRTAAVQQQMQAATASVRNFMLGMSAGFGAVELAQNILRVGQAVDGLKSSFTATFGQQQVAAEMDYIRQVANDLGLEMLSTAKSYSLWAASAKGTVLEAQAQKKIFEAVAQASRVLNLSVDDTNGTLRALSQMISKGKVQAEELRGQLGERLPGAFQMAAKAMGVTTAELDKMLRDGKVLAADLLPKLAVELDKAYGGNARIAAVQSLAAETNRLKNSMTELSLAIYEAIEPALAQWARDGAEAADWLAENLDQVVVVGEVLAALLAGKVAVSLATTTAAYIKSTQAIAAEAAASAAAAAKKAAEANTVAAAEAKKAQAQLRSMQLSKSAAQAELASAKASLIAANGTDKYASALARLQAAQAASRAASAGLSKARANEAVATTAAGQAAAIAGAKQTAAAAATRQMGLIATASGTAMRGLSAAMTLLGGPIGIILLGVTALVTFHKEIYEAVTATGKLNKATRENDEVLRQAEEATYKYAEATGSARDQIKARTQEQIKLAQSILQTMQADLAAAQSRAARAAELDQIGSDDPFHVSLSDTREREVKAATAALAEQQRVIDGLQKSLDNMGKTKTELDKVYVKTKSNVDSVAHSMQVEQQIIQSVSAAQGKQNEISKEAAKLIESLRTPQEEYNAAMAQAKRLLDAGEISQEQYNRALAKEQAELQKSLNPRVKLNDAQKDAQKVAEELAQAHEKIGATSDALDQRYDVLTTTLREGELAGRALELRYESMHNGMMLMTEAQAEELQQKEFLIKATENEITVRQQLSDLTDQLADAQSNLNALQTGGLDALKANEQALTAQNELKTKGIDLESRLAREYLSSAQALSAAQQALEGQKKTAEAYASVQKDLIGLNQQAADEAANLIILQTKGADALEAYKVAQQATNTLRGKGIDLESDLAKQYITSTRKIADLKKQQDDYNQLLSDAESLYESTRTDAEKYAAEIADLDKLQKAGVITQDTYNRALKDAQESYTVAGKAAAAYKKEQDDLNDKIKVLEAGLYGGAGAARAAELGLKNYNAEQVVSIQTSEDHISTLERLKNTADGIGDALVSGLISGDWKTAGEQVLDSLQSYLLDPIADKLKESISKGVTGLLEGKGFGGGSGTLFGNTGTGGGIMATLSGGGWQGALMGGGLGMMAGQAFGQTGIGSGIGGAIGSIWGPIGTAAGSLLGGFVESLFGGKQSIRANFGQFSEHGNEGRWYHTKRDGGRHLNRESSFGAFGLVDGSRSVGRDDPEQVAAMHAMLDRMKQVDDMIASFLPPSTVERIKQNLAGFEGDALKASQLTKARLVEIFKGMDAPLRQAFQGGENVLAGTAEEIAARFQYIAAVNQAQFVPAMEKMGWNLGNTEAHALAAAVGLADAAGGLDQLKSGLEQYYQTVFTADERLEMEKATAQAALDAFNAANNTQINSLEAFRHYVEGLDKQTAAGQAATAAALELTSAIATLYGTADEAANATNLAAQASEAASPAIADQADATDSLTESAEAAARTVFNLESAMDSYMAAVYTTEEQAARARTAAQVALDEYNAAMGLTGEAYIDNVYELRAYYDALIASGTATDEQIRATLEITSAIVTLSGSADDLAAAANDAAYDVAGLRDSISGLVSQLYSNTGSGSTGNTELDNAQAQLESLRNQYSAEQQRIQGLNSAAQEAYNAELNRIRDLNAANDAAYREQIAQYDSLKGAAESLRDFVEGWTRSNPLLTPFEQLQEIQSQYNTTLAAARAGDVEAAQELQTLAGELRSAYLDVYASSGTSENAINQITSDLSGLAGTLDTLAGSQPTDPGTIAEPSRPGEVTSTLLASLEQQISSQQQLVNSLQSSHDSASAEADRQALALELATQIGELGLALDESVFDLLRENGVAISALAADFGVNIDALDGSMLSGLDALADALRVDTVSLAAELGADFDLLGNLIADKLSALPNVPDDIRAGLAPYLAAIEAANDDTRLRAALGAVEFAVNGVAPDIRSQLSGKLTDIVNSNNPAATVNAVNALQSYINSLPSGIRSQLNYQLSSILTNTGNTKTATDAVKSQAALINSSVGGLPPNIKSQLNGQLNNIVGYTSGTQSKLNQMYSYDVNTIAPEIRNVKNSTGGTTSAVNSTNSTIAAQNSLQLLQQLYVSSESQAYAHYNSYGKMLEDIRANLWGGVLAQVRNNLRQQNANWHKQAHFEKQSSGFALTQYRVGTDALPSDGPIMAHKYETIFNPSQSLSLRDKVLANMDVIPATHDLLADAANEPRTVQQEIHVAPNVIDARPVFADRQPDNQEQYIRRLEKKFDEQTKELQELREMVRHYGNVQAKQGDERIGQGEVMIKQQQQARKDARLQQQLKEANGHG